MAVAEFHLTLACCAGAFAGRGAGREKARVWFCLRNHVISWRILFGVAFLLGLFAIFLVIIPFIIPVLFFLLCLCFSAWLFCQLVWFGVLPPGFFVDFFLVLSGSLGLLGGFCWI